MAFGIKAMLDNLNGKMTLFESAADGLEIAVGEQLTPAMSDLSQGAL